MAAEPDIERPRPGLGRIWHWLRILIAVGMIAGLVTVAKPARLWSALVSAHYLWVLAAVPFAVAAVLLDSLRLYLLVVPVGFREGWRSVLRTNLVVNFISLFLPGTVGGGALAWYRLSKRDRLRAQMFVALSLNTLLKLIVICSVGALAIALDARAAGEHRAWIVPLALIGVLPLAGFCLMLWTKLPARFKRLHETHGGRILPARVQQGVQRIFESLEIFCGAWPSALAALGASVARALVINFCPLFCLHAVGVADIGYLRVLWISCAVEAAAMIPLTLSGWGLPQVAYVSLYALSGVSAGQALASHIVSWVAILPVYAVGASILLAEALKGNKEGAKSDQ